MQAARPLTTPIYDLLKSRGAQFGASFGLEVPLWYAPEGWQMSFPGGVQPILTMSGQKQGGARICWADRNFNFAKYSIEGPGAAQWLDSLLACKLPAIGRMTLPRCSKKMGALLAISRLHVWMKTAFLLSARVLLKAIICAGLPSICQRWLGGYLSRRAGADRPEYCGPNARAVLQN